MADVLRPDSEDRLAEVIAWAAGEDQPLEVIGLGTKRALGHEVKADYTLDLSAFSGIRQYEPAELVMTLGPATPLLEVQKLLHDTHQMLAFEPPNAGRLLQGQSLPGSIGGVVGCGLSGPRRFRAGAVRDHVLGIRGVTGRGEVFKSGGKVVKNVTGYDLSKVLTGSYGTLAALTEVTLKVLPAPKKVYTLLVYGLKPTPAVEAMRLAASSPHEPSGLCSLSPYAAHHSSLDSVNGEGRALVAIRFEGVDVSVKARIKAMKELLKDFGPMEELHTWNSETFWWEVGDGSLLPAGEFPGLWRISLPPSEAPAFLRDYGTEAVVADWAGGLLWLAENSVTEEKAEIYRSAVAGKGHAMLVRAPAEDRRRIPVFHPMEDGLAGLNARVKRSFDPKGILNPGRMGDQIRPPVEEDANAD